MADEDDLETTFSVTCPYCGERVEIYLEPDVMGTLVQDCEVCCNPLQVTIKRDRDGDLDVRVERAQ
jgi:cysteine-rich CPXCG protein